MKMIILDRDGVINEDTHYIKSPKEWIPIPGSLEAIAALNNAGYTVVVATNQSGIARGYFDEQALAAIHQTMTQALNAFGAKIDRLFYCPHGPDDGCNCRKPKPGLFQQIAQTYDISLKDAIAVGDSLRDIQAAQAVGATPILVLTGKGSTTLTQHPQLFSTISSFDNLWSFTKALLEVPCLIPSN